jgi:type IV fimbrial biogenesis protein FimT
MDQRRGFTLVELLTSLAFAGIVLGLAWPAFADLLERTSAATARHRLSATLMTARSTAIMRREAVSVCPSADGRRCSGHGDWSGGWIVYQDPGHDAQPASAEQVLRRGDPMPVDATIESSAGRTLVRFQRDGRASGTNLTLRICSRRTRQHIASVILSNSGRARTEAGRAGTPCPPRAS